MTASWAALGLAELIAAVSEAEEPADVITTAQRVGTTLHADVTAVVRDGALVSLFGDRRDATSASRFSKLALGNERFVRLHGRGNVHVVRGGRGRHGLSIVLARADREFTVDERGFVQAAGRLLDHAAAGLSGARDRRELLDVLSAFHSAMVRGDALVDVLRGLAVSSLDLLHADRVELSWTDPNLDALEVVTAHRATLRNDEAPTWLTCDVLQPGGPSGSFAVARGDGLRPLDRDDADVVRVLAEHASIALNSSLAEERDTTGVATSEKAAPDADGSLLQQVDRHLADLDHCSVTMILVDLDGFGLAADRHEQARHDRVLTAVSDRLRTCVRETDLVGRLGNDQFVLVCPGISEIGAMELAERFQRVVHEPIFADGLEHCVTASVGIAGARVGDRPSELVANADLARRRAQERGLAQIEVYGSGPEGSPALPHDADIDVALRAGEIRVELQPVVALPARRVCGFSAVARWDHDESGTLGHSEVYDAARRSDLEAALDRAVVDESLSVLSTTPAGRPVSVRLGADTLLDEQFAAWLEERLEVHDVNAELLALEVPESVFADADDALGLVAAVRDLGVALVLGGFGSGSTSVRSLQTMPVNGVSIDRSLTDAMSENPAAAAIVAAVLEVASASDLAVTIRGIDDDARVDFVNSLAAMPGSVEVRAQGELFGPPADGSTRLSGFVAAPWSSGTPVG